MLYKYAAPRRLRLVRGAGSPATPSSAPAAPWAKARTEDGAGAFYDATIGEAWRVALALCDGDRERAGDAAVAAYAEVWAGGAPDRIALLAALVERCRRQPRAGHRGAGHRGAGHRGAVVPLAPRRRGTPPPLPA